MKHVPYHKPNQAAAPKGFKPHSGEVPMVKRPQVPNLGKGLPGHKAYGPGKKG